MKKQKSTLKLNTAFQQHYNRNVGRIKSVNPDGTVTANINPGHGGGEVIVSIEHCYEFEPMVSDRVLLCVDETGVPGYFLKKLPKDRQEASRARLKGKLK